MTTGRVLVPKALQKAEQGIQNQRQYNPHKNGRKKVKDLLRHQINRTGIDQAPKCKQDQRRYTEPSLIPLLHLFSPHLFYNYYRVTSLRFLPKKHEALEIIFPLSAPPYFSCRVPSFFVVLLTFNFIFAILNSLDSFQILSEANQGGFV